MLGDDRLDPSLIGVVVLARTVADEDKDKWELGDMMPGSSSAKEQRCMVLSNIQGLVILVSCWALVAMLDCCSSRSADCVTAIR